MKIKRATPPVPQLPQTALHSSTPAQQVRVGVLEDEPAMRNLLNRILAPEFKLWFASSGSQMFSAIREKSVDLVLLDILLPGEDGIVIAKSIRARSAVPMILLSALSSAETITTGLNVGADDYVTKPFHAAILRARMRNVLRRRGGAGKDRLEQPQNIEVNGCTIDLWSRKASSADGTTIKLSEKELQILTALAREPERVVDRDALSRLVNGQEWTPSNRCLDVHICHLRKKLKMIAGDSQMIASFRGIGYALKRVRPADLPS